MNATTPDFIAALDDADQATRDRFEVMCSHYEDGQLTLAGRSLLAGLAPITSDEDAARWPEIVAEMDRRIKARQDTDE